MTAEKKPIHELCKGVPSEDETKHIPPCRNIEGPEPEEGQEDNRTCKCYIDPATWWESMRINQVCPLSNQASYNYLKHFTKGRKVNPLKQSKRSSGGKAKR